jgi:NADP-dependent 3-hydroxy acid dehydrogenase YdfG
MVDTEIRVAAGFLSAEQAKLHAEKGPPMLKSEDVSNALMFLLSTPYTVNVTELTIRPVGEAF